MQIQRWMKRPVHTVKPLDSIVRARDLIEEHRINQLPVVVDGWLVGIVTDRDVRSASPSVFESAGFVRRPTAPPAGTKPEDITVEMVMTANVVALSPRESMADAARLMRRERIGAIPIVEANRLVGILTRSDLLDAFVAQSEPEARPG